MTPAMLPHVIIASAVRALAVGQVIGLDCTLEGRHFAVAAKVAGAADRKAYLAYCQGAGVAAMSGGSAVRYWYCWAD